MKMFNFFLEIFKVIYTFVWDQVEFDIVQSTTAELRAVNWRWFE